MTKRIASSIWSAATVLGLAMAASLPAAAQDQTSGTPEAQTMDQPPAALKVAEKEPLGQFLVDGEGMSLYLLEADVRGSDDEKAVSTCYDECAEEWPPFTPTDTLTTGEAIADPLLSTIERTDGAMQVTYNGWPLYHYHDDEAAGDTTGQDKTDKWGEWYLVTPSGEPVEEEAE